MAVITEEFVSGFCKAQNQTRMTVCEFEIFPDGSKHFRSSDCDYGQCPHSAECILMKQLLVDRK